MRKLRFAFGRIQRRVKGSPDPEEYAFKVASLLRLEELAQQRQIALFYGDECGVALLPCVPYGWRFKDERLSIPSTSGKSHSFAAKLAG